MLITTEINLNTNYFASLEVISNVFPEIKNTGYKIDLEKIITTNEITKFETFYKVDIQKSFFFDNTNSISNYFKPSVEFEKYYLSKKNELISFESQIKNNTNKLANLISKIKLTLPNLNLSIIDAPSIGFNVTKNEIIISPRISDVPFLVLCLNGILYLELFKHLDSAIERNITIDRFSEIANYLIVSHDLWIECINQSFNYNGPKVTSAPSFAITEKENDFIQSIGFHK